MSKELSAQVLFEISRDARDDKPKAHPMLPPYVLTGLSRMGFTFEKEDWKPKFEIGDLVAKVLDGSIWEIRGMGEKAVMYVCVWLMKDYPMSVASATGTHPYGLVR